MLGIGAIVFTMHIAVKISTPLSALREDVLKGMNLSLYYDADFTITHSNLHDNSKPDHIHRIKITSKDVYHSLSTESTLDSTGLTVLIMTHNTSTRLHNVRALVADTARWEFVRHVIVVWNKALDTLPMEWHSRVQPFRTASEMAANRANNVDTTKTVKIDNQSTLNENIWNKLAILHFATNNLDNRWQIAHYLRTTAVLNIDDDIQISEKSAYCMWQLWARMPQFLFAITVRMYEMHVVPIEQTSTDSTLMHQTSMHYTYEYKAPSVGKPYSLALPHALLIHKIYFDAYAGYVQKTDGVVRSIVDRHRCDDLAFNFVVGATLNAMNQEYQTYGHVVHVDTPSASIKQASDSTALWRVAGMHTHRVQCIEELNAYFGHDSVRNQTWNMKCL